MKHTIGYIFYAIFIILAIASMVLAGIAIRDFRNTLHHLNISDNNILNKLDTTLIVIYALNIFLVLAIIIFMVYQSLNERVDRSLLPLILLVQVGLQALTYYICRDIVGGTGSETENHTSDHSLTKWTNRFALPALIINILATISGLIAAFTL